MSKINSPRAALDAIVARVQKYSTDGHPVNQPIRELHEDIDELAREGRELGDAPTYFGPTLPTIGAGLSPFAALMLLVETVGREGVHYLPCDWLRGLAREGLKNAAPKPGPNAPWPRASNATTACGQLERYADQLGDAPDCTNVRGLAANIKLLFEMTHADIDKLRERVKELQPTPVQAAADQLLAACFEYADLLDENIRTASNSMWHDECSGKREVLGVLLAPLRPLPPPTVEDLAAALQAIMEPTAGPDAVTGKFYTSPEYREAKALLARVPK